jgi:hypothetical protein
MRNKIMRLCLPIGLMLCGGYQIVNHFIHLSDNITIPVCIISILFMLVGIFYHGWCFGKHKNSYEKE